MNNQQVAMLAKLEKLDLDGDTEYFNRQLSDWLKSLCQIFGEEVND